MPILAFPTSVRPVKMHGAFIRVRPSDKDGGAFGPSGGVFFSVQRWLNDVKLHL